MLTNGGSVGALKRRASVLPAAIAAILFAFLAGAPPAGAVDTREEATALYKQSERDKKVRAGWTGSVKRCRVGRESQRSIDATFRTVNAIREFAGLESVAASAQMNKRALAAALMMHAKGALSHSPGRRWPCYSKAGAMGASHSTLAGTSGANAIWAYMNEGPDFGHRRWVLFPGAIKMGTGSTGKWNALYVIGSELDGREVVQVPEDNLTAWPSADWFPAPWIPKHWSLGLGNHDSAPDINLQNADVLISIDGVEVPVRKVESLEPGFGMGKVLGWEVKEPDDFSGGEIAVTISGVKRDGEDWPIGYVINAFDPTQG